MFKSFLFFVVISCAIPLLIALGLIASQQPRDRTGATGLDFSSPMSVDRTPNDLVPFQGADGDTLYMRRYDSAQPDAPLLVLVHGSGWHSLGFDPLADRIAAAGLATVLVPDLRGHGPNPIRRGDIDYIGQLEDDLHALITSEVQPDQNVILGGHSSGGGLVIRYAGGTNGQSIDAAILMAPFLQYDAPTTRPNSGGWAEALTRRLIGLSMLNSVGITALNHLSVIDFAFPQAVLDGPLGDTATRAYSYRLNTSFAPRRDYLKDVAALPPFLLVAGLEDEAFEAKGYEPLLSSVNSRGTYATLEGVNHLDVMTADGAFDAMSKFLSDVGM